MGHTCIKAPKADDCWIQTYTGKHFHTLEPRVEDVCIEDIAHALSLQCRFSGHTLFHYSVAQHSVLLADEVHPLDDLWGLLHDASEAYLVDLPRPIKRGCAMGDFYREIEDKLMKVICQKFNLPDEMPRSVHEADARMLTTEKRDLMPNAPGCDWSQWLTKPYEWEIDQWTPDQAEAAFLYEFKQICRRA